MAIPTVFISSTFYDLRYVRETIKRFVESLGYSAVLSEDGTVFYDPKENTADACIGEVGNAHLFVLILGGRYGSLIPATNQSVTNGEYQEAVRRGIPIFALVEQDTYNDYRVYRANKNNADVLASIAFPHADSIKIFEFIDDVQSRTSNNSLVPFRTASDVEVYLRAQWAGMMHAFLTTEAQQEEMSDNLAILAQVNNRIELLAEQILRAVGTPTDRVYVKLIQEMMSSSAVDDLRYIGANPTVTDILSTLDPQSCANRLGRNYAIEDDEDGDFVITSEGEIASDRYAELEKEYGSLRARLERILADSGISSAEIAEYEALL